MYNKINYSFTKFKKIFLIAAEEVLERCSGTFGTRKHWNFSL